MKDIDFDELDRAVSSLMGSVTKDEPTKPADTPAAASTDDTAPTADEPEQTEANSDTSDTNAATDKEPEQSPASASAATPPTVSRGRFMDVVRPGRDIRKPSRPIRRQGVTIQPSVPERPAATPSVDEQPSEDAKTNPALQAALMRDLEDTASVAATSVSPVATPPAADSSVETDDTTPLSSPFLPDAKVEKRPLGRPTEAAPAVDAADEPAEKADLPMEPLPAAKEPSSTPQEVDAQLPEEPLPAELDSKLLSIETDTTTQQPQEPPLPRTPSPETPATPAAAASSSNSSESAPAAPATDVSRAMAAASIPQQYKLKTEPGEAVPAGAIYDTQPLAHPARSTPGWLWIAAIVGILVLGAALGAGVYYLGLL